MNSAPASTHSSTGFKEWANVCEALSSGVMSLILRKGGLHEGRGGFEFKHREFFLFPTWFHTQGERLTWSPDQPERFHFPPEEERTTVDIDGFATLEKVWRVTEWEQVAALAPMHVWAEEIVRERFIYDEESCLNIALVRAYKLPTPWHMPYAKSYGGCRSWITLPQPPAGWRESLVPALSDAAFAEVKARVEAVLG